MTEGKTEVPNELIRWQVMKAMGWDYYTYRAQPDWLIDEIMDIEGLRTDVENAKLKQYKK